MRERKRERKRERERESEKEIEKERKSRAPSVACGTAERRASMGECRVWAGVSTEDQKSRAVACIDCEEGFPRYRTHPWGPFPLRQARLGPGPHIDEWMDGWMDGWMDAWLRDVGHGTVSCVRGGARSAVRER